jgi:hypothetical protein
MYWSLASFNSMILSGVENAVENIKQSKTEHELYASDLLLGKSDGRGEY